MTAADKAKAQLVIVTGMLVLYFIFKGVWFLYIGTFVGVVSIAIPSVGNLIVKGWYKLAEILGAINGRILLSLVFFLILFPVALLARIGAKNPLSLKNENRKTAFSDRNHTYTSKDLDNVW